MKKDPFLFWVGFAWLAWSMLLAYFIIHNAKRPPAVAATPAPVEPPVVRCILDSAQIARFATYFTPAEN